MLKVEPTGYEITDTETDDLMAKIECFDEECSSIDLCGRVHTPESWEELAFAIKRALWQLHPAKTPSIKVDEEQLKRLRENGAEAWAGVDPQALRESYSVNSA